jgi:hypothetical protein
MRKVRKEANFHLCAAKESGGGLLYRPGKENKKIQANFEASFPFLASSFWLGPVAPVINDVMRVISARARLTLWPPIRNT